MGLLPWLLTQIKLLMAELIIFFFGYGVVFTVAYIIGTWINENTGDLYLIDHDST